MIIIDHDLFLYPYQYVWDHKEKRNRGLRHPQLAQEMNKFRNSCRLVVDEQGAQGIKEQESFLSRDSTDCLIHGQRDIAQVFRTANEQALVGLLNASAGCF